jgi:hypothetical protein
MTEKEDYAQLLIRDLQQAAKNSPNGRVLLLRAADFLNRRLTEAAIGGCHHCHEGDTGTPCWWCGLKNRKRLVTPRYHSQVECNQRWLEQNKSPVGRSQE